MTVRDEDLDDDDMLVLEILRAMHEGKAPGQDHPTPLTPAEISELFNLVRDHERRVMQNMIGGPNS